MSYYMLCLLAEPLAVTFGDPHMITLDGVEYTFNGYGEYHILQVAGPDFNLQGRCSHLLTNTVTFPGQQYIQRLQ